MSLDKKCIFDFDNLVFYAGHQAFEGKPPFNFNLCYFLTFTTHIMLSFGIFW